MARKIGNSVMHNTRGIFAKQVVFKERAGRFACLHNIASCLQSLPRLYRQAHIPGVWTDQMILGIGFPGLA